MRLWMNCVRTCNWSSHKVYEKSAETKGGKRRQTGSKAFAGKALYEETVIRTVSTGDKDLQVFKSNKIALIMATIYICGVYNPDDEKDSCVDTEKVKARLKSLKCAVVNPSEMAFSKMSWSDTLSNRVELLKKSQAVYVLPNWRDSIMARIELTVAMDLKLQTFFHPISTKELKQLVTTLDG